MRIISYRPMVVVLSLLLLSGMARSETVITVLAKRGTLNTGDIFKSIKTKIHRRSKACGASVKWMDIRKIGEDLKEKEERTERVCFEMEDVDFFTGPIAYKGTTANHFSLPNSNISLVFKVVGLNPSSCSGNIPTSWTLNHKTRKKIGLVPLSIYEVTFEDDLTRKLAQRSARTSLP